jgi:hypothetical protein
MVIHHSTIGKAAKATPESLWLSNEAALLGGLGITKVESGISRS